MDWVAEDTAGRVPLGLTVFDASVAAMTAQARHAERAGADWVILQPPPAAAGALELMRVFGRVADAVALPVAIQNAPGFFERALTAGEVAELAALHPNPVKCRPVNEDSSYSRRQKIDGVRLLEHLFLRPMGFVHSKQTPKGARVV
jgi:dihydrodipicolinate synthase/N-acetylneuraminate lyase